MNCVIGWNDKKRSIWLTPIQDANSRSMLPIRSGCCRQTCELQFAGIPTFIGGNLRGEIVRSLGNARAFALNSVDYVHSKVFCFPLPVASSQPLPHASNTNCKSLLSRFWPRNTNSDLLHCQKVYSVTVYGINQYYR